MKCVMENWRDEYLKDCGSTYQNHVNKFIKYLISVEKGDSPNLIALDDVDKSVGRYNKLGNIKTRGSMESHLESIKSFYDYLREKGKARDIFTQMNYENFKNELVKKYNLTEKLVRESFSKEVVIKILKSLDNYFNINYSELEGFRDKERYSQRIILRLFCKINLIAPAKRQVICNIKFGDFDLEFRSLTINNVNIRIPNSVTRDIIHALNFAKFKGQQEYTLDTNFFDYIYMDKFSDEYLNSWFCNFLKEYNIIKIPTKKLSYPIEPLMITAIEDMVNRLANPALIALINGNKIGTIEDKYYKKGINSIKIEMSVDEAINWEISKSEYYNFI